MNLLRAASGVSLLTLVSRITGLARELLLANALGASAVTDAFNVAFRIPNFLRRLFAEGAFSQAFVPVLAQTKSQEGKAATVLLAARTGALLFLALLVVSVVGVVAAPWWVWGVASGLQKTPGSFELAVLLTRCMFPYILLISLVSLMSGVLNVWGRFAIPAFAPVLLNVAMMGATVWGLPYLASVGVEPALALAGGVMLGGVLQLACLLLALRSLQLWYTGGMRALLNGQLIRAALQDARTRRIGRAMLPSLLGVGVAQVSLLINTQIASHLAVGSVSWLTYADRLMEFPTALLGVALGVVLVPQLARAHASGQTAQYSGLLDWGLRWVVLLALPCALALAVLSTPLVATLYHHGAFSNHDVAQTALAVSGYGVGLLGLVAIKVLAPAYYASGDFRTPVRVAVGVLLATQGFNAVLVPWLGHAGLALSIGLGALLNAACLLWGLVRRGHYQPLPGWAVFLGRVVLSAALLLVFWHLLGGWVDWMHMGQHRLWRAELMALVVLASAALYGVALSLLGLPWRGFLKSEGQA